jgi:chromosomal replication initiator protein
VSRDDDKEIVPVLRNSLIQRIGQDRFDLWFGDRVQFGVERSALIVSTAEGFRLEQIRSSFRRELAETASQVLGDGFTVEFQLDRRQASEDAEDDADAADDQAGQAGSTQAEAAQPAQSTQGQLPPNQPTPGSERLAATKQRREDSSTRPPYRRFAALETFVVGDGNRLAHTAAEGVVQRPGAVTPVLFHGPTGCGKTHLLEGLWTAVRRRSPSRRVVLLSAEQFTTYFVEALRGSGLPSFRRKYRDAELLLIDDVQFLVGKRATIVELLHTIDTFVRAGRQLVLSADRPPAELAALGPEVTARLGGGLVCGVDSLDRATRLGVLRQLAARSGQAIPDDTLELLAERLGGDARLLGGAMHRLLATSAALARPIDAALAEQALGDIFHSARRAVHLSDVEQAVCEVFGVAPDALQSGGKSRVASQPRMLAMWLARRHTRAAFSEIGRHFGRRSHSTVISAEKKVNAWRETRAEVQLAHGTCSVEDAIRRIESRLRCG